MLNKEELKYKEYIGLRKKLKQLGDKLDELPNIKLKEPYQRGWIVTYDVRDDIKRRKDYPEIKLLIEAGYDDNYTNNVNVVKAIRRGDTHTRVKSRWGNLDHISNYYPRRREINEKTFLEGGRLYERYFNLNTICEVYRKFGRKYYHLSIPSYWLELKIKPNMITHRKSKGGAIEKEYQAIYDRVWMSGEFFCYMEDYGSSYPAYKDRGKIRTKISRFKNGLDDDIYNEKVPREYHH